MESQIKANQEGTTWTDLIVDVFNRLSSENASVSYRFNDLIINVPSSTGKTGVQTEFKMNGTLTIEAKRNS